MNEDQKIECANFDNMQVFQHVAIYILGLSFPHENNWASQKQSKKLEKPIDFSPQCNQSWRLKESKQNLIPTPKRYQEIQNDKRFEFGGVSRIPTLQNNTNGTTTWLLSV
jgi:hypothetical protein